MLVPVLAAIFILLLVIWGSNESFTAQVVGNSNDQLTTETVVYRPAWNHNTITLPTNPSTGRMLIINLTGGGPLVSSDKSIYTPVNDNTYNNKSATGLYGPGNSLQLANNRNHVVTFDGTNWVAI